MIAFGYSTKILGKHTEFAQKQWNTGLCLNILLRFVVLVNTTTRY